MFGGGVFVLLQKLDANRGWARLGYSSLFDFCHLSLNLTRAESYSRTRLARPPANVPQVISLLKSGAVSVSAMRILAPVLTVDNFSEVPVAAAAAAQAMHVTATLPKLMQEMPAVTPPNVVSGIIEERAPQLCWWRCGGDDGNAS